MPDLNQHSMQDPTTQYSTDSFPRQPQTAPGLASEMTPKPDHGESTYQGSGKLKGRKALVTGGDSGIGRAAAIAFAREGADVVINYLPEEEADAQETLEHLKEAGVKGVAIPLDITSEENCRALVDQAVQALNGSIDILVNNAGKQTAVENIADITTEQFDLTYKTNVYAMFWITKFALASMPRGAVIINTTSIQAYQPSPQLIDYASTKAAIANFTHGLAQQLAPKGIRVNGVAPGPIWTPLQPSGGQLQDAIPDFGKQAPLGRAGQPAELGPVYVFLASQESSYITGEIIGVTGGQHLP